jgi:hypothetical protein
MRFPNFFIVGAPRCGTTALHRWLGQHKDIFMAQEKETHFFADDLKGYQSIKTAEKYSELFKRANEQPYLGEASVLYLMSEVAVKNILKLIPDAKFIVTIRNPVDIVTSWHKQLLVTGQEDVLDFYSAWNLQESRRSTGSIPSNCMDACLLQYGQIGSLGNQIKRITQSCNTNQILFIQYDDLCTRPAESYTQILKWLGLAQDGFDNFSRVNENRQFKSLNLKIFWQRNTSMKLIRKVIRNTIGEKTYGQIRDSVLPFITQPPATQTLSIKNRSEILDFFAKDIEQLTEFFNQDFSHWK